MSARNLVGGLAGLAVSAAKHPVGTAGQALGVAKGLVGTATGLVFRHGGDDDVDLQADPGQAQADEVRADEPAEAKEATEAPAKKAAAKKSPAKKAAKPEPEEDPAEREPQVVFAEPAPPQEPPVDIVEQVLAAENEEQHAGRAGEPKAASRDEEHGDAALQRAETDEWAEEQAEAAPQGSLDIDTPVHTTGADVGFNPDTAEADLQQPQTEPVVTPATVAAVKSESDTLRKASKKAPTKKAPAKKAPAAKQTPAKKTPAAKKAPAKKTPKNS